MKRLEEKYPGIENQIRELNEKGLSDQKIAEAIGIGHRKTIADCRNRNGIPKAKRTAHNKITYPKSLLKKFDSAFNKPGTSIASIARQLDITYSEALQIRKQLGYKTYNTKKYYYPAFTQHEINSIIKPGWRNCLTRKEILTQLGKDTSNDTALIKLEEEMGIFHIISHRKKSFFQNNKVFETLTPYTAYYIGFFLADGHMKKNEDKSDYQVGFTNTTMKSNLENLSALVTGSTNSVYDDHHNASSKSIPHRLTFYGKEIYDSLALLGFEPRKSYKGNKLVKIIHSLNERNGLFRYFIRGFFDGDGITMNDPKNGAFFGFVGDIKVITVIKDILEKRLKINGSIRKANQYNSEWVGGCLIYTNLRAITSFCSFIYAEPETGQNVPRNSKHFHRLQLLINTKQYEYEIEKKKRQFAKTLNANMKRIHYDKSGKPYIIKNDSITG